MGLFSVFSKNPGAGDLKRLQKKVEVVNALEEKFSKLDDNELREQTNLFKNRIKEGETLDDIAPEAFAVVREAAKRVLGQRHYDVQIIGGFVIHEGKIAEMRTGEGKTLVATLPVYLNALEGKGVHMVTVNDYLARRDASWMGQIYNFLGLSISVINSGSVSYLYQEDYKAQGSEADEERDEEGYASVSYDFLKPITRSQAYEVDITYGTNSEFGFDYLRDNLVYKAEDKRQRGHNFVIIDEIDSVLIDEARTPLIISAPHKDPENLYQEMAKIVAEFREEEDYTTDEKTRQIQITEEGIKKAEAALELDNLYASGGTKLVYYLETAVRAKALFQRDREYVVQNGQVVIVDQSTGRLMPTRRWSGGLHQAVEAKEGFEPKSESRTFASVTYQNFFRMYDKLSGMTGTALTSGEEFFKVYSLEVIPIPTNKPIARIDRDDLIFQTRTGKFKAIARKIKEVHEKGQPVLVGTVSVENNELLAQHLSREKIPHKILNAKNHEAEGEIVADAGKVGAVTIATNMAGRGVDIKLGGETSSDEEYEDVKARGGLFVMGTERHPSRRIDNQLRGRSGRQGDPGETQFFVSLEDDLMRVFASDKVKSMMGNFGIPEDEPIGAKMISKALESAQERIEGHNFDARKNVLSYDDVLNTQRQAIYEKRDQLLAATDDELIQMAIEKSNSDSIKQFFELKKEESDENKATLANNLRRVFLQVIDILWVDHLETMDFLRTAVGLRAYGQRDPLVEYRKDGLREFSMLEQVIDERHTQLLGQMAEKFDEYEREQKRLQQIEQEAKSARDSSEKSNSDQSASHQTVVKSEEEKIGRNDLVTIKKGEEVKELKWKKAEPLVQNEGWARVSKI